MRAKFWGGGEGNGGCQCELEVVFQPVGVGGQMSQAEVSEAVSRLTGTGAPVMVMMLC